MSTQLSEKTQERKIIEKEVLTRREADQLRKLEILNVHMEMVNYLNKRGGILEKVEKAINSIKSSNILNKKTENETIKVNLYCNPGQTRTDMKCMKNWIEEAWQKLQNAKQIWENQLTEQNEQLYLAASLDYIRYAGYANQSALKTIESVEIKENRGKEVWNMTDLARNTGILESPIDPENSEDLSKIVEATIGVFLQNNLVIDGEEYEWFMKQTDIDAKFRDSGYSDMTLIFRVNVKGIIACFEFQINTKEFIDAKVIETKYYQAKKKEINTINNLLELIANFHGKKASKIKLSKMDNMMKIMLEKNLLEQLTKDSSLASKEKVLSFIAPFLRSHINLDAGNLDKYSLNAIADTFDRGNFVVSELFKAVCDFAKHFKTGREAYEGIGGVIKSPIDADEIDKKARKLPNAKAILERGKKEPNTIIKRV